MRACGWLSRGMHSYANLLIVVALLHMTFAF
jgi:quinol-cytochrome oxidoreductase complex cytochrome b subunit